MPTIRDVIIEYLERTRRNVDDDVILEIVRRRLTEICQFLPSQDNPAKEALSADFTNLIFGIGVNVPLSEQVAKICEKALNPSDDLRDYHNLRQALVAAIQNMR